MRIRLRDMPDQAALDRMYAAPHDHALYGYGHGLRVEATISLGRYCMVADSSRVAGDIADLSTGNAAIPRGIAAPWAQQMFQPRLWLGDYAPGYDFQGPIETTVAQLAEAVTAADREVEVFVLSETVEHLDDPEVVLEAIRPVARQLLLSTPIGETDTSPGNPEHVWGWDQEGVEEMLVDTGWEPQQRIDLVLPDTYSYQVWRCT